MSREQLINKIKTTYNKLEHSNKNLILRLYKIDTEHDFFDFINSLHINKLEYILDNINNI